MRIFKEKAGVISEGPVWVFMTSDGYMYIEHTLPSLIWMVITEWKNDKHLVG